MEELSPEAQGVIDAICPPKKITPGVPEEYAHLDHIVTEEWDRHPETKSCTLVKCTWNGLPYWQIQGKHSPRLSDGQIPVSHIVVTRDALKHGTEAAQVTEQSRFAFGWMGQALQSGESA